MGRNKIKIHDFYCLNCGQLSMSLPRQASHLHSKMHLKKLYCPKCKIVVNHIEIKNDEEKQEFLFNFKNNMYEELKQESLILCDKYIG